AATAIAALERLVAAAYRPGDGLAHGPGAAAAVRGLLADQWAAAAALIAAHELTGDAVWAMLAEELARGSLRRHRDAARGGFFDRPPWNPAEDPPGLLRERIKPVRANAEAARVLRRLARLSGDGVLEDHARATLAWAGTLRGRTLEEAAACALAVID
ncbi:MAG TPA: hypothetical protein VNI83_12325, partial [Vicinamibacterales bacterium]|nr:hypothetical protein [Vicinamibacterales bacterium]